MQLLKQKLYDLSRMHCKLCRLIRKLNSSAGFTIFHCLLSTSVYLVVTMFRIHLQLFQQKDLENKHTITYLNLFVWLATYICELRSIVHHSVKLSETANKTPVQLHQLRNKVNLYDVELDGHIQIYSLHLLQQKVSLSAWGFFELDYSLIFTTFGGVLTYLVILIQLDESSSNDEEALSNSTTSTILP
ncbi:unnamed protein product [Callosobruchus maculatus]|uniref:Gustatory receptor n=1 Tax=Callosobruchus maculatus TaxID=64391 RepID=A0A653DQ37_CALMS|nr:unnamed protein product [Callosobruchus maculatus]